MNVRALFDLGGHKALVTGAGRGIGKVLALGLADAGCDVSILEINLESAQKVAEEIKKIGRKAVAFQTDVTKKSEVDSAFAATVEELGGLDICLNVAGVCVHEPAEDIPEKNFDFVVDTNLKGVFFCCQAAAKIMIPRKKGSIINIASMSGTVANVPQKQAPYNASKAGVVLLTKCLAVEWAPYGIRVNSISPGYTRTELVDMAAHMFAQWESLTPMGRMCTPDELIGAAIYLASNASSYTTGSDLIVDGGYTAR
jgi:NAD(P)-dependent dehydrogenase (short-subunit alcohol dehydrogenase family)